MRVTGMVGWAVAVVGLSFGSGWAQTTNGQATPTTPAASVHHHHPHRAAQAEPVTPHESQGVTAPVPNETEAQRAADQRLLKQQQAQSAQAAVLQNQVVQQAVKQQQQIQQEVRIQDAPGPANTGVVPAAGAPVAPVNANDRIQDAPGPAQTVPPPPATTVPANTQTPAQQPASPPQG